MVDKKSASKVRSSKKNRSKPKSKAKSSNKIKWGPFKKINKSYRPKNKCFVIEQDQDGKCVNDSLDRFMKKCYVNDDYKDCPADTYNNLVMNFVSSFLVTSDNRDTILNDISKMSENKLIKTINDKMPSLEQFKNSHKLHLQLENSKKDSDKAIYSSIYTDYKSSGYGPINTFMRGTFGTGSSPFNDHLSYKLDSHFMRSQEYKKIGDSSSPILLLFKYLFNLKKIVESKENSKKYNKIFLNQMKKSIEEMSTHFLEKTKDFNKTIKNIKLGIKKSTPIDKDIVLFRGFTIDSDIFDNMSFRDDEHKKNILNIKKFNDAIKFSSKGKWSNIDGYGEKTKENKYWTEPLIKIIPKIFDNNFSNKCKYSLNDLNSMYNNFYSLSISKLDNDSTFIEKGFTSTSYNPEIAKDFGGLSHSAVFGDNKHKCIFRINVPKGTKCFTITQKGRDDDYNETDKFGHDYEYEVILPPGKYKVNDIFKMPSKYHETIGHFYHNECMIDCTFLGPI